MKSTHLDPLFPTFRAVPVFLVKVFRCFPLLEWAAVWTHGNMGLLESTYLKEEKSSTIYMGCEPSAQRRAIQFAQVVIGSEQAESENTWLGSDLNLGSQPSSRQGIRTSPERERTIWWSNEKKSNKQLEQFPNLHKENHIDSILPLSFGVWIPSSCLTCPHHECSWTGCQ